MPQIVIVVNVENLDATLVDPHVVADDILDLYEQDPNADYAVAFVSAEWKFR